MNALSCRTVSSGRLTPHIQNAQLLLCLACISRCIDLQNNEHGGSSGHSSKTTQCRQLQLVVHPKVLHLFEWLL